MSITSPPGTGSEEARCRPGSSVEDAPSRIAVVGLGGAGSRIVSRLGRGRLSGADTVALNSDVHQLAQAVADRKLLIGREVAGGLGAHGDWDVGRRAAQSDIPALRKLLQGYELIILVAGLGGGTGTGALPVLAGLVRDVGAMGIGIFTTALSRERLQLLVQESPVRGLQGILDSLILLDRSRLLQIAPHLSPAGAFSVMDQVAAEMVSGLSEAVSEPSLINLDYADLRTVIKAGQPSAILVGEARTSDGPEEVIRSALHNPLLEADWRGATRCLLHITAGEEITLREASAIALAMTRELDPQAHLIWGARVRKDFGSRVRVTAIVSGFGRAGAAREAEERSEERIEVRG
ncbi:MAG: cell division protein FtsZ [Methanosarcinales archaeon]|nr:cell division protein FtsZ [Methanosarcinales archaeon]